MRYDLGPDGALPDGLSLDVATHTISGTPRAVTPSTQQSYTVEDLNGGHDTLFFQIEVVAPSLSDITAPDAYSTEATAAQTPLSPDDYGTATSTDTTAIISHDVPDAFPLGETVITWTA
ncbi:putative Ig domain-containing protein [Candidatus Spongiihabitans sp.]|uniref:putative Ig domain-containing protein n=1 Tax=Candidatus Spongiihabitans sp. TaxID=3101308 RepID=UPI003C7E2366